MQISDESRWIQVRVYATLVSTYLAHGKPLPEALALASHQSAYAAVHFERTFPPGPTIDTESRTADPETRSTRVDGWDGMPARDPKNGAKMQPGIENFQAPPKES